MSHTLTPALGLTKTTGGSGEPWNNGAHVGEGWDILDAQFLGRQFNARSYGAVGDGSTDDTTALQNTLDAAGAYAATAGGAIVIIPPGTYKIAAATRLTMLGNITISAYGATLRKATGATSGILANFVAGTDTFSGYTGNSNITIMGGIWDANGQNAPTDAAGDVIDFNHCRRILVKDVEVRNTFSDHALEFNSTDDGIALNCRFVGFRDATSGSTRQYSEAIQIDCAVSGSASIGAFDGTHSKNIRVTGCYMGPAVDGSSLGSFGKLVGSHTTASGQAYRNIQILGNICDGALDVGIGAYNWVDSVIADNVVYNTTLHGIRVTVPDPTVVGFSVLSSGVVVRGNTVDTPAGYGIQILGYTSTAGVTDCSVVGNTVRASGMTGIFCQLTFNQLISGNVVDGSASNCINVMASQYPLITGNWTQKPATNYCIAVGQVTSPSTVSTTDGQISDNVCILGGAGPTAGIRLSTGTDKFLVAGNTIRLGGGSQTVAIKCAGTSGTTVTVDGNDCKGFGDTTTTITNDSTGTVNKSFPSTTNIGRNIG